MKFEDIIYYLWASSLTLGFIFSFLKHPFISTMILGSSWGFLISFIIHQSKEKDSSKNTKEKKQ